MRRRLVILAALAVLSMKAVASETRPRPSVVAGRGPTVLHPAHDRRPARVRTRLPRRPPVADDFAGRIY